MAQHIIVFAEHFYNLTNHLVPGLTKSGSEDARANNCRISLEGYTFLSDLIRFCFSLKMFMERY